MSRRKPRRAFLVTVIASMGAWLAPTSDAGEAALRAQSIILEQPLRISAAMSGITRPAFDGPAMFFLGFAGFGEEKVFAEEIRFAAGVIAGRYGTGDRSLLLVNDRRESDSDPIATVSSLRYALKAMAGRMDVEEDVLFLALSSHGSEDHLAVSHEPLMLDDLTAPALAEALDEAGIKWRVVVISACYSGSFIDELDDPHTIVITAAAADRSSFGCSDDRDLTYFGEAFYRDALPNAASLRAAFEQAVEAIEQRERREDVEPSNPQAHFGRMIEVRVGMLDARAAP